MPSTDFSSIEELLETKEISNQYSEDHNNRLASKILDGGPF